MINTDNTGQIVKRNGNGHGGAAGSLVSLLDKMKGEIARALPKHVTPERMSRIVLTSLRTTKDLEKCTPASFIGCVMSLAQLGLEPNTPLGHAYLIPRNNRKKGIVECTVIIGYPGQLDLSYRSGRVSGIDAEVVREGDEFSYEKGLTPKLKHVPSGAEDRETKRITHAYAIMRLKDGDPIWTVLSMAQIQARKNRSSARNDGPWVTDFEAMCRKTALRANWALAPKSSEMARAEALEVADESGHSQSVAFDPAITEALAKEGLSDGDEAAHVAGDAAKVDEVPVGQPVTVSGGPAFKKQNKIVDEDGKPIDIPPEREPGSDDE
jgi:recombination protein RecT